MPAIQHAAPRIPVLIKLEPVGQIGAWRVLLIDASTSYAVRSKAAEVAYTACRDTPTLKIGYDGSTNEAGLRMYIVADGPLAIAMATVQTTNHCWKLRWVSPGKACVACIQADETQRARIGQVWVCHEYRGRKVAANLIDRICANEVVERSKLGWQLPFSRQGRAFVQSIVAGEWFGDGAEGDLEDLLTDPPICPDALGSAYV